ncbi:MAG TPA: hypothetical protein VLX91_09320 [Candidatus Acidoferrales bacterium]|nr:hypothetical protein [Candidatus Acidoferrales bacterium]
MSYPNAQKAPIGGSIGNKLSKGTGSTLKKLAAVTIYAVAMGYLESAVVIYLRECAFGNSVQVFPIQFLEPQISGIEFVREASTIVMLLAVGYLAGRNRFQQCMFFVYAFAIWDIFYYIFLKLFTGWPGTIMDYDVLFLIPVAWISPVICPVLISLLLTLTSAVLIFFGAKSENLTIAGVNLVIFLLGAAAEIYSFTEQIFRILLKHGTRGLENFRPASFDWPIFLIGFLLLCVSATFTIRDCYRRTKAETVE